MLTLDSKFSLTIDFAQIIELISKLPFVDNIKGSLDITQYRKIENANKNWDSIEGKWTGDETDEQIYKALVDLS